MVEQSEDVFETARLKLDRAGEHLSELRKILKGYSDSKPVRAVLDPNYSSKRLWIRVSIIVPPPEKIKAVLGDLFHNLRSALDTAIYPLVEEHFEDKKKKTIQFLISEDQATFEENFRKRFSPYLNDETVALISSAKPFKGGNGILHALSDLNNIDKHRYHLRASSNGYIDGPTMALIVPPGIDYPPNDVAIGSGGLGLKLSGSWQQPVQLKRYIESIDLPRLPSTVYIEPPSLEREEVLDQLCVRMHQQVVRLVNAIAAVNPPGSGV